MNLDCELDITDLTHDGRGVARHEGKTVFVQGALPGERVRARRVRKHRQYDEAQALEVLQASPQRTTPRCPHFGTCGGCSLQHLAPEAQIEAKQRTLIENFERIGQVRPRHLLAPLMGSPWGYRRRGRLSVKWVEKKNRVLVGFREGNGRYVAELNQCPVLDPAVGNLIPHLAALIESLECKQLIAQIEFAVGDAQTALVLRNLAPLSQADAEKLAAFGRTHALALFLQPGGNDSVQALDSDPQPQPLFYALPEEDLQLQFDPLDFIQVNGGINRRMIAQAMELLAPTEQDSVLDLYCGLGNFTLPLARRARAVVGVEGEPGLVARARANARRNGIENAEFAVANLGQDQREAPWAHRHYDLMLLDPARAGAAEVLAYLPKRGVRRVVYVSCHPASLARDAGTLVRQHGFELHSAGVMDMFPHTGHVESIALFAR